MNKVLNLTYASSLTNLCEMNSSFDTGVLRIAYAGENRNRSCIDKQAFEKCIKTIFNCPIVCNYDIENDTLGGHDIDVMRDKDGGLKLVNLTTPIGCIPESARVYWETVEEDDGETHEYLCAEALLWKRQAAYKKIKEDGITNQSMEITVKDGKSIDGVYHIYDFEFTAFALIGVTPCFESAALEFSKQDFKQQLSQMMLEIKETLTMVNASKEDDNIHPQNYSMEGGEKVLKDKLDLVAKYGLSVESLGFSVEDISIEGLEEKLKEFSTKESGQHDAEKEDIAQPASETAYALESEFSNELARVMESEKVQREWGECKRYWFVDYDKETNTVYCWDTNDWLLYGFTYKVDGDSITIDYTCKKRKKFAIVDFDEGEQGSPFAEAFSMIESKMHSNADLESKYQKASETISSMEAELTELRQFKNDTEKAITESQKEEVFAKFEDLVGVEAFEALRNNPAEYDVDTLEEKCFAIRGRNASVKFAFEPTKAPKLKVEKTDNSKEPYGGVFQKYGVEKE